eukprot:CAMPEP_0118930406 /NCGR_PEP_ID=MMETSP1169-20130426/7106_1 /TAXON_ID=36882 /ORGANISM="Pyramimonas obovata, Strain CCMP722" /LENGTH=40 /DNA_ID= /DNA_START= /DNA_END= /DNA_ORIENTATION=
MTGRIPSWATSYREWLSTSPCEPATCSTSAAPHEHQLART